MFSLCCPLFTEQQRLAMCVTFHKDVAFWCFGAHSDGVSCYACPSCHLLAYLLAVTNQQLSGTQKRNQTLKFYKIASYRSATDEA